jgi:hypothetical protein
LKKRYESLQPAIISLVLGPHILFRFLFSNFLTVCPFFDMRGEIYDPCKTSLPHVSAGFLLDLLLDPDDGRDIFL